MKRIIVLAVLGVIVIAGVFAVLSAAFKPVTVQVGVVRKGNAIETVYATGFVECRERRVLRAPRAGIVHSVFDGLLEGSPVKAGQPILELRDTALESRLNAAQAELERINEKLQQDSPFRRGYELRGAEARQVALDDRAREQRLKQQLETGGISRDAYELARTRAEVSEQRLAQIQQEYDQALADLHTAQTSARSSVDTLRAQQFDNRIVSPIDGVILRLPLKAGEFAASGVELAKVGDSRELIIESEVNEDDIARVKVGQRVLVRLAGYDKAAANGRVYEILPDADRATKGYTVRVAFSEARAIEGRTVLPQEVEPRSGMTAELGVIVGEKEGALVFPRTALTSRNTVFVIDGGRVRESKVSLGLTNFSVCEALTGLEDGQRVAISNVSDLSDGAGIRVKE
ncbi:MAG: efflux RND transporter periplasmic adaptor subunit [Planctomycetes bacterium]|nr:efflux RND transporter periplasmic adaptor subunit [Planctomycetota bacterium]MCW8134533.1 efflux RND transporter periplasmic adaptor subunit [Planctomycetota bacterium]